LPEQAPNNAKVIPKAKAAISQRFMSIPSVTKNWCARQGEPIAGEAL
jgi:hypothetical protein